MGTNSEKIIYFIRNSVEAELNPNELLDEKLIAIHYGREFHERFEDYKFRPPKFEAAFRDFQELGVNGGLVVTQYSADAFYVGEVAPGTKILPLSVKRGKDPDTNFLKTLKLASLSSEYKYSRYPLLSALRPPFITIAKLNPVCQNLIYHLHFKHELALVVTNLHPKMLEQMTDEFLRSRFASQDLQIRFELLKTGLTMPDIDIYAETTNGKSLYVQVTHATEPLKVKKKANTLLKYINEDSNVIGLFVSPSATQGYLDPALTFLSTEVIFNTLKGDPDYNRMLHKMIGIQIVK